MNLSWGFYYKLILPLIKVFVHSFDFFLIMFQGKKKLTIKTLLGSLNLGESFLYPFYI